MGRSKRATDNTVTQYKLITKTLEDGLARLEADKAYYTALKDSPDERSRKEAVIGLKATNAQIPRQRAAIKQWYSDMERAVSRGDIPKFW